MKPVGGECADLSGLEVLVVDDEADIRFGLRKLISGLGADVSVAADGEEGLRKAESNAIDIVLTDLMMPKMSGTELLAAIKERMPAVEVVVLTGFGTIQGAVSCLHGGAAHFMTKPFDNQEVLNLVSRIGRQILARRKVEHGCDRGAGLVSRDPVMQRVMELVTRVAKSPVPVLIEGESGCGKDVIACAIHERSAVASKPFLAVNAAALSDTLLESELFGHVRGSFTGADRDRKGIFREAEGGTVFLDEVSSMSKSFQGKILRVLQEKQIRPVGASRDVSVEFRLVAATNRDLEAMVRKDEFREDLFYRLGVVRVHVPPLRERPGDIEPLAMKFLARASRDCLGPDAIQPRLTQGALDALLGHDWQGNVRELQNAIQRAVIVSLDGRIRPHHLGLTTSPWNTPEAEESPQYDESKQRAIERFQREFVQRALEAVGGNVSHAAQRCGLTRAAFQRIMRQLDIDRSRFLNE